MATLLDKARTLASASIPALLDQALKTCSLVVLDQFIRHAQDNLDDLNDAAGTIGGQARTLRQKASEFDRRAQDLDQDIDSLLLRGSDALAVSAQHKLNSLQQMAREYRRHYQKQHRRYQQILNARLVLEAKLTAVRQEREQVQALIESAPANQAPAQVLCAGEDLIGAHDPHLARMAGNICSRLDGAGRGSTSGVVQIDEQIDHLLGSKELEIQLAERRRRLGLRPRPDGSADGQAFSEPGDQQRT